MNACAVGPNASLLDAIRVIENSSKRMVVVLSEHFSLLGTITDGDIRRCLLMGGKLESPVHEAMNKSPLTVTKGSPKSYIVDQMRKRNVLGIPVLDRNGIFLEIIHLTDLDETSQNSSLDKNFDFAVIMAGGEGTRLRPITLDIPKPMIEIGGIPLIERQIQKLVSAGIRRVYISVNYLSEVIEKHFRDGSKYGLEIRYLREEGKLGTAGSLGLLPEKPSSPIVVMNGDILTTSDFNSLYTFHCSNNADITAAAIDYRVEIPYGVFKSKGVFVEKLEEKPSQRFLCNAGIYALSPCALDIVESPRYLNMTDLIESCLGVGRPVAVFPIHEYWNDIGTPADLEKARSYISSGHKEC